MTTKPKTRKAPAPGVNPKLIALAAKIDEANAELGEADEGLYDFRLAQSIVGDLLAIGGKP